MSSRADSKPVLEAPFLDWPLHSGPEPELLVCQLPSSVPEAIQRPPDVADQRECDQSR
jgi:hypothetical protein